MDDLQKCKCCDEERMVVGQHHQRDVSVDGVTGIPHRCVFRSHAGPLTIQEMNPYSGMVEL